MSRILIPNASPVICLAKAGHLPLLARLCDEILLPDAVALEILAGPPNDPARSALEGGWAARRSPSKVPPSLVEWGLGAGETSVLALAMDCPGSEAVLDDAEARTCARSFLVPLVGTLGLVLRAARQNIIPAAAPVLRTLVEAGMRLDSRLIDRALQATTGESWEG